MKTDTLTITFDCNLSHQQVPRFRGAVLKALPQDKNVIFHNHSEAGFRYSYPLVQYKVIGGKAAILFIDKGIEESGTLIAACNRVIQFDSDPVRLTVSSIIPASTDVMICDEVFRYKIDHWLPINERNMPKFQACHSAEQLTDLLSNLLTGHILSFAKGLGLYFDEDVQCEIAHIDNQTIEECKHVRMIAFDAEFITNVRLPEHIGLGKHASFGYGQITKINI